MDMNRAIVYVAGHAPCFDNHCKGFILLLRRLLHAIACYIQRGQKYQKPPESCTAVAMAKLAGNVECGLAATKQQKKLLHVQLAATLNQDKDPLSH